MKYRTIRWSVSSATPMVRVRVVQKPGLTFSTRRPMRQACQIHIQLTSESSSRCFRVCVPLPVSGRSPVESVIIPRHGRVFPDDLALDSMAGTSSQYLDIGPSLCLSGLRDRSCWNPPSWGAKNRNSSPTKPASWRGTNISDSEKSWSQRVFPVAFTSSFTENTRLFGIDLLTT